MHVPLVRGWFRSRPACAVLVALASCSFMVTGCSPYQPVSPPSASGTLNRDNVTFSTPLDVYSMSLHDIQIVSAARAAALYQCVLGQQPFSADVMGNIRQWLDQSSYLPQRWLFGFWQAAWLAPLGALNPPGPTVVYLFDESQQEQALACAQDQSVVEFEVVAPMYGLFGPGSQSASVSALGGYWMDSYERTRLDPGFLALNRQRNDCTTTKGYSIAYSDGRKTGNVDLGKFGPDGKPTATQLLAALTEAQCADSTGYTQQVVNIMAGYQAATISAHQSELVAIKQTLNERVANATQVLAKLGIQ